MAVSDASWAQFTAADYSIEQWRRACLIDTGEGDTDSKDRYKLPVREPDGTLNRNGVHAAASVLGGGRGGVNASTEQKQAAARKLMEIYRHDLDEEPPESLMQLAGMNKAGMNKGGMGMGGMSGGRSFATDFLRAVALDDIHIRSGGDGRTVEAYAAIFNVEAEVMDQDGHYLEVNSPSAWNKTIADRAGRFPVIYHHGMTLAMTPSDRGAVPIGVSTEVRADSKGVLTVARYNKTPLADEVLEAIRNGDVVAQSYSGRYLKSDPMHPPRGGHRPGPDGRLRTVTRLEVAMREFGPTPFPAFSGAMITGVRAQQALGALLDAPPEKLDALLRQFDGSTTPAWEPETPPGDTSALEAVAQTEEPHEHSARSNLRSRIRAARIIRGME